MTVNEFHILLALASGSNHGYEIMKLARENSNHSINMGPGTLYGSIDKLEKENLIKVAERKKVNSRLRIYYKLTNKGTKELKNEARIYDKISAISKDLAII